VVVGCWGGAVIRLVVVVLVLLVGVPIGTCSTEVRVVPSGIVSVLVIVFVFPFCVMEVRVPVDRCCGRAVGWGCDILLVVVVVVLVGVSMGTCSTEVRVVPSGRVSVLVITFMFPSCVMEVRVPVCLWVAGGDGILLVQEGIAEPDVVDFLGFCISAGNSWPVFS